MNYGNIEVTLLNEKQSFQLPSGTKVGTLIPDDKKTLYIAARVNNVVTSLSYSLKVRSTIEFIKMDSVEGMEVYRRSLAFLLAKSVNKLMSDNKLIIMHSLGPGYYYELAGCEVTDELLDQISGLMHKEIQAEKLITRGKMSYEDALTVLKKDNSHDKIKLLETLHSPIVTYYQCDTYFEMVDAPLAPSTGFLKVFSLIKYDRGFILQFPRRADITKPAPFIEQRKIFEVYRKHKELGRTLHTDNVGSLNSIITSKGIKDFIQVSEALQEARLIEIASAIAQAKDTTRLITIAGPSSSGKTTFSKRLELQLKAHGLKPKTISVDNYFVDREKTPVDENGDYDYESIYALNLDLFNEHLNALFAGKTIHPARYDFLTGKSGLSSESMSLMDNEIVVIEGIHCLNEKLTYIVPREAKYKIYISALSQMNIDNVNRIPTTDNRVIRRLVRDFRYRGHSAQKTLDMWPSVRRGEELNIFPYQNDADGYFNSALDYELAILKSYAEPILMQVSPSESEYGEARRLLKFLSYFLNIPADYVPPTSLLREFIGGSYFNY